MKTKGIGLIVFVTGNLLMVVGALLPWYLLPLYLQYALTEESVVPHVWGGEMAIYLWMFSIPIGAITVMAGGLLYGRSSGVKR